jgi:hypothetical protein
VGEIKPKGFNSYETILYIRGYLTCTCILEKRKKQSNKLSITYSIKWKTEKNTPPSNDSKTKYQNRRDGKKWHSSHIYMTANIPSFAWYRHYNAKNGRFKLVAWAQSSPVIYLYNSISCSVNNICMLLCHGDVILHYTLRQQSSFK